MNQQAQLVRDSWQQNPLPRLLVFDNCEKPELLQQWRPITGRARVLLTSRRARWDPAFGIHSHPLETLSRPASAELLRRFRPDLPEGDPTLGRIAEELGDLPLALHLAGSFLQRYQYVAFGQPKAYLEELQRGALLNHSSLQGERAGLIPTSHDAHVARTFALSYERLNPEDRTDAIAQRLLARASYFAPGEAIPRKLLKATLGPESLPAIESEDALGRLIDLGLLEQGEDGQVVMHRLVAHFAKQGAQEPADQLAVEDALNLEAHRLNEAGYPGDLIVWQPHLRFVVDAALDREDEVAASLCSALDVHLSAIGDYAGARRYSERALAILEKVLGPEHPTTTTGLNNLGDLLQDLGDLPGARPYLERALRIREKVLGPEHPATTTSLNNLGMLLLDLGDLAGAQPHLERALAIREKVLGPEHPTTAVSLNNLGILLRNLGDLSGAQPLFERALAIREKVLSPEHPKTALSLSNLGMVLGHLGDFSGARSYLERALAICEKVLGPEHPHTKIIQQNLDLLLKELSKPDSPPKRVRRPRRGSPKPPRK